MYDRLVEYAPVPEEHYAYFLAESSYQDEENRTIVVLLRENAKWSDGSQLTAQDVVCNYNMRFMVSDSVWQYLTKVEALDDRTVAFTWHTYSDLLPRMAYNLRIEMGYTEYGKWADEAAKYLENRVWDETQMIYSVPAEDQDALINLREDCYKWLPDITTMRTNSAYYVESVNANEIMCTKNPYYWNADKVYIDHVRIQRYVSAEAYLATVMQGGYDTEPHGLTPDLFKQLEENNPDMVTMWVPDLGQPAFEFNVLAYPVDIVEVRQAIAFIVDRELLLEIAEPGTMPPDYYATGLTPLWRDAYMTDEMKAQLTEYVPNYEKADELLTSIGWTRGKDGYWQNEKGETVTIEVSSMNSWPIFFACGEAASLMLDEYGIKSTFQRNGTLLLLGLHQQRRAPDRLRLPRRHDAARPVGSLLGHLPLVQQPHRVEPAGLAIRSQDRDHDEGRHRHQRPGAAREDVLRHARRGRGGGSDHDGDGERAAVRASHRREICADEDP